MKSSTFLLISEGLLILCIFLIASGLQGSVGFNAGWPLSQFSLKIIGEATGGRVAVALFILILAAVNFVAGLIGFVREKA